MVESFEEHFVAAVVPLCNPQLSTLEMLRQRHASSINAEVIKESNHCDSHEVMLVSSPGFGVIDSGCGRTIIGRDTLKEFESLWKKHSLPVPSPFSEVNHFKFGNGQRETTEWSVRLPVIIAGRSGSIKAAVVKGAAPLLISRSALQTLQAVIDFGKNELTLFNDSVTVPLTTNAAGQ